MPGRATIGLYNSYDRAKFHEAHRRAIARAAPIALAFDCNLATFGFPFDKALSTPSEISQWVASTTSIGEGGRYFIELAEMGRFSRFGFPNKGFPPQLGRPIVTTCGPEQGSEITVEGLRRSLDSGQSLLIVFGLGPRGLPREVRKMGKHQLDVTGRGFSLETCTAMGAVIGAILAGSTPRQ